MITFLYSFHQRKSKKVNYFFEFIYYFFFFFNHCNQQCGKHSFNYENYLVYILLHPPRKD